MDNQEPPSPSTPGESTPPGTSGQGATLSRPVHSGTVTESGRAATSPGQPASRFWAPTSLLGRYDDLVELAHGGMGVVFRGVDRVMGRTVALKMIRTGALAEPGEVERFIREARSLAQMSHPHIVQIHDLGEADGCPYFTMRFAEGGSLAGHVDRFADPRAAALLIEKVARAVHHAHERGILHRDLKPANVLLDAAGEPLVSDFGLVKLLGAEGESLTQSGTMPGTPLYMAPEQAAGRKDQVGPRTDIWALGVMLYELLEGRPPFKGGNREEVLHRVLTMPVPPLRRSGLDPALRMIVMRCLEKEPARRYATAADLADDLACWQRGELRCPHPGWPSRLGRAVRRHPFRAAGATLVLLFLVAFGIWLSTHGPEADDPDDLPPASAAEPPIQVIGRSGRPETLRWLWGGDVSAEVPSAEGLALKTNQLAMVQLGPAPLVDPFVMEAELRHDRGEKGYVGLFFVLAEHRVGPGPQPVLFTVGVADRGTNKGQMSIRLRRLVPGSPFGDSAAVYGKELVELPFQPKGVAPWRRVKIELLPPEVRVSCDGEHAFATSLAELRKRANALVLEADGLEFKPLPCIGIGVFLEGGGEATFRNFLIRRRASQ